MVNNTDFAKRLHKILHEYELSASSFADKIHVGRATISHILSGRNKPSLDFVMKVVQTFPQVDIYWLLNGKGTFPKTDFPNPSTPLTSPPIPEKNSESGTQSTLKKNTSPSLESVLKQSSGPSKIKRIVIFMEDGTFESYDAT